MMKQAIVAAAVVLALGGALSACETATPYQPLRAGSAQSGGYTETQIEANRWRVTFRGNSLTSRQTVENYLLYRAAELTVDKGYDWFEMADRHTSKHTTTYPVGPYPVGPYGFGWAPSWRYYGGRHGWRTWDPYWGGPFWADDFDLETVQRFEASAEFVMGHGSKPEGDAGAFDARQVQANLGPKIVKPN